MAGHLTLAIIKPHVHRERKVGKIFARIEQGGFSILLCKLIQMRVEGAQQFYKEHEGKEFFPRLVERMCIGPVWVMVLSKPNVVEEWRKFIGATDPAAAEPGTIRHDFGNHKLITDNAVHGSSDDWAAKREINFFFNREITVAKEIDKLTGK